jgi:signal transduction histidine kinase
VQADRIASSDRGPSVACVRFERNTNPFVDPVRGPARASKETTHACSRERQGNFKMKVSSKAAVQVSCAIAGAGQELGYHAEELHRPNGVDLLPHQNRDAALRGLERSLAEAQHRAEELRLQNAELQSFAHTVAHDLREPLRSISVFTELLVRKAALREAHAESARFIVDGVRRMSTLLDGLLASATHSFTESLRPVNLEHAAAQALENLRAALKTSGALCTICPLPTVPGIESDLVRVFQNLIENAVKYRSAAPLEIRIIAERCGPDVVIRVCDNGIGIAKEQHRTVFGLFRRLPDPSIPGAGIGLAVCKNIVEGLGGTIWVESELGSGSSFCFTIRTDTSR